ncbi:hypothetical protein KC726_03760 [Candidatus Woesebacteria bacterium]|nr:hypothetical protein [Candidatus Woesebacteria bacterium]
MKTIDSFGNNIAVVIGTFVLFAFCLFPYPARAQQQTSGAKSILQEFLDIIGSGTTATTNQSTSSGNSISITPSALIDLYRYVGNKVGVPACVLEAVSYIEWPTAFNYTPEEVQLYSQPGQRIPNCAPNTCSASGHMQMTTGIDPYGSASCSQCCWQGSCLSSCPNAWGSYGNAIQQYENISHMPDVCNLTDSTYAAAQKLKNDSNTSPGDLNWSEEAMHRAGERYYGNCTVTYSRLGDRTYCGFIIHQCNL